MAEDRGISLLDYARKQRRKDCAVCGLPTEVREQMVGASDKKIKRSIVLAWLRDAHGIDLTPADMVTHASGHHET